MNLFTAFLEIFTTLIFCVILSMLSAMAAQVIYTYWSKYKSRKRKMFYYQKRQDAELQKRGRMLNKLIEKLKIVYIEKEHLLIESEALRRELKLYGEIRSDMMSHSIQLESDNFDLRSELNQAYREITAYKDELSYLASKEKARLEEEYSVELDIAPDAFIQAKGVSFEELEELPSIMQGTSEKSDMEAAAIVAKVDGTILFDQLQEQIKDSKVHIGSLIDRLEKHIESPDYKQQETEAYFYENTGFSIRDFLPAKSA